MADNHLPEEAVWEEGIRQVETTDTVLGGPGGVPNLAPGQLANRTLYLKQQIEKSKDDLVGLILPDSTALAMRPQAFIADGSAYQVEHYPKLMGKVQGTAIMVSQSLIDANPEQYAACYGISDDGLTFTVPNYPLRPHIAAAGVFGSVGTSIEDQIQNITGELSNSSSSENLFASSSIIAEGAFGGLLYQTRNAFSVSTPNTATQSFDFDASRIARTGAYTEVNSSFLNFYIIHGEVA